MKTLTSPTNSNDKILEPSHPHPSKQQQQQHQRTLRNGSKELMSPESVEDPALTGATTPKRSKPVESNANTTIKPQFHWYAFFDERLTRRVQYVRKPTTHHDNEEHKSQDEQTVSKEGLFFMEIEMHKNTGLERICICPPREPRPCKKTLGTLLFVTSRLLRAFFIVCCPPLCYILPRAAFWPPTVEYYFFQESHEPSEDIDQAINKASTPAEKIHLMKAKHRKLTLCCKEAMHQSWRIGMKHACAKEIEGVEGFVVPTKRGNYIAGVYIKSPKKGPRNYILYSHPNATDISDHLQGIPNLKDMARVYHCDVYSYDYSGYGISSGSPTESNQNADIEAIYDFMVTQQKVPPNKIVLLGYSIGTCASVDLAYRLVSPVAGVILQAPPASMLRILLWGRACYREPNNSNQSCCLDNFTTVDKVLDLHVPVLVIHGEIDATVPAVHGRLIHERLPLKTEPLFVQTANHDNLENFREVWIRIRKFLKKEIRRPDDDFHITNMTLSSELSKKRSHE